MHQWFLQGKKTKRASKQTNQIHHVVPWITYSLSRSERSVLHTSSRAGKPLAAISGKWSWPECSGPIPPLVLLTTHSGTLVSRQEEISHSYDMSHALPNDVLPLTQVFPPIRITHHISKEQTLLAAIARFTPQRYQPHLQFSSRGWLHFGQLSYQWQHH